MILAPPSSLATEVRVNTAVKLGSENLLHYCLKTVIRISCVWASWFRVICGVGMTAGILSGREFHDFDARAVGIVDIEMDFSLFLTVTFSRQPG